MIMSSSLVILKINTDTDLNEKLQNVEYEENDAFYSLSFDSLEKNSGELHWTNSFKYGKMNMVSFLREGNYFYLFTSSIDNKKILTKVLKYLFQEDISLTVLKTPLNAKLSKVDDYSNLEEIDINKHFGITALFNYDGYRSTIKVYTNGLITYRMTNNIEVIKKIIFVSKQLIEECEANV